MVCSVLFLLPSLPRAPANHVLAASGTPVPGAFSAHAFGKLVPVPGAGVGARRAGVLDEAAHGHMPASAGVVPVPGARCCAGERQERHLDTPRGCHARSSPGPALQFSLPSLLRFPLEKQIFSHLGAARALGHLP